VNFGIAFAPLVPEYVVWGGLVLAIVISILLLLARSRGALIRAVALVLMVLALANPVVIREQRQPLDDVAVLLVDRSPSQTVGERPQQLDQALAKLRAELKQIDGLEVVEATSSGDGKGGTRLFATLGTTLPEIDRSRLAGVLMLSDGQVHDVPKSLDALAVVKSVGPDLPEALAIVLVPEGVEVDKKDLPAFAREFSNHMPLETALEVVSDFLSFNPLRSLFTKFRGVLTAALDGMKEPPSGKT